MRGNFEMAVRSQTAVKRGNETGPLVLQVPKRILGDSVSGLEEEGV